MSCLATSDKPMVVGALIALTPLLCCLGLSEPVPVEFRSEGLGDETELFVLGGKPATRGAPAATLSLERLM